MLRLSTDQTSISFPWRTPTASGSVPKHLSSQVPQLPLRLIALAFVGRCRSVTTIYMSPRVSSSDRIDHSRSARYACCESSPSRVPGLTLLSCCPARVLGHSFRGFLSSSCFGSSAVFSGAGAGSGSTILGVASAFLPITDSMCDLELLISSVGPALGSACVCPEATSLLGENAAEPPDIGAKER